MQTIYQLNAKSFSKQLYLTLHDNLDNPDFHLGDLCQKLYMSRANVYRKIRTYCNSTFSEILLKERINRAMELLEFTDLNIYQISERVGFRDDSYFVKVFKKYRECTPGEFRQKKWKR